MFYAEAQKGFVVKVTFDALALRLSRSTILFKKDGIYLRDSDQRKHVLFDVSYLRANFKVYRCLTDVALSFNVKFLQKLIRNVKKKDSIIIRVDKDNPETIVLAIKSDGNKSVPRVEFIEISVQREKMKALPALPDGRYGFPMVIDSSEFQKIKKFSAVNVKVITVRMQSNNFIAFLGGSDKVFKNRLEFGELVPEPEDVGEDEEVGESGIKGFYEEEFNMNTFNMLVKMAGLGTRMQFYRPRVPKFPLLVKAQAGDLGTFQVFIKDKEQIEREERFRGDQEETLVVSKKKK